jgi:hypothetical protein
MPDSTVMRIVILPFLKIYDIMAVTFAVYINCSSSHQNHGVLLKQPSILWKLLEIYVLPN